MPELTVALCSSLQVYPTTMRALGLGTSGSLCRIGAMVAPFISQVQPTGLCREDGSKGGGKEETPVLS